MAVSFRHGSNGSYKSAYAVWFEIVPALRSGRLVITNVEGLKSLEGIEKALGEKFPESAQLIRLFSRSEEGVFLWQNWFSWCPIGALIIIDECQDLFTKDVGFVREKAVFRPLEDFLPHLPDGFSELFYSRWLPVPDSARGNDGEEDDSGRTQYDESGRLLYPYNFYGAFMRHRKYQWDIVMLTPDWTSIPTWLRGCAQSAFSHSSKDSFLTKRRPRVFYHAPQSSKSQPTTKQDYSSCTNVKIPIDVFALYKSTGTGDFNESKSDLTMLKSPKFILSILVFFGALSYFMVAVYEKYTRDDKDSALAASVNDSQLASDSQTVSSGKNGATSIDSTVENSGSVATVRGSGEDSFQGGDDIHRINVFHEHFPMFNDATAIYFTFANVIVRGGSSPSRTTIYGIRIDKNGSSYYLKSSTLAKFDYSFKAIDDCLISVEHGDEFHLLTCPPYDEAVVDDENSELAANREPALQQKKVDIFSL